MITIIKFEGEVYSLKEDEYIENFIEETFNDELEECFVQAVDGCFEDFKIMGKPYSEARTLQVVDSHEFNQQFGKWYTREMAYTICELNEYGEAWIGDIKIMRRGNKD